LSYYITDADIGDEFFEGETVPGTNTVATARNTRLKAKATAEINRIRGSTANATDVNDDLKDIGMYLYKKGLDGFPIRLSKQIPDELDMIVEIMTRFGAQTGGGLSAVPIYNHDPQDGDYDLAGWHDDMG
jgi:hypothetical protein